MAEGSKAGDIQLGHRFRLLLRVTALYTLASCAAMLLTGSISKIFLLILTLAVTYRIIIPRRGIVNIGKGSRSEIAIASGIFLYMVLKAFVFKDKLLPGLAEALIIYQVFKWISPISERDFFILSGVAYIEVVATASLTTKVAFMPVFVLFTVLNTIVMFLIFISLEQGEGKEEKPREIPVRGNLLVILGSFGFLSLLITFTIFICFPRLGAGLYNRTKVHNDSLPGSYGIIDLKESTFSDPDFTVIARVKGAPGLTPPLYLKTVSLSGYDRDTWSSRSGIKPLVEESGFYYFDGIEKSGMASELEIFLDLTGQSRIPIIPGARGIRWRWGRLFSNREGDVTFGGGINYPVRYGLLVSDQDRARGVEFGPYLSLTGIPGEIFNIAASFPPGKGNSNYSKVRELENYLRSRYGYSRSPGDLSLISFLGGEEKGNCQHFATSAVLLARAMGLPARIAGGFTSSELNSIGGYWMFRKKDAHAWAEVYLEERGWVLVDATPIGPGGFHGRSSLGHLVDWVRHRWQEYVVGYNLEKQVKLSKKVLKGSFSAGKKIRETLKGNRIWAVILIFISSLAALIIYRNKLWAIWAIKGKEPTGGAFRIYLDPVAKRGARMGVKIKPSETPSEYIKRLGRASSISHGYLAGFSSTYYRVRYGNPCVEDVEKLERLMKEILQKLDG